jgi:hypothetical protein
LTGGLPRGLRLPPTAGWRDPASAPHHPRRKGDPRSLRKLVVAQPPGQLDDLLRARSLGSKIDEATIAPSGTFLHEAIRIPILIVGLHNQALIANLDRRRRKTPPDRAVIPLDLAHHSGMMSHGLTRPPLAPLRSHLSALRWGTWMPMPTREIARRLGTAPLGALIRRS